MSHANGFKFFIVYFFNNRNLKIFQLNKWVDQTEKEEEERDKI